METSTDSGLPLMSEGFPLEPPFAREIGRVFGGQAGPTLIVVAGIHGNEPAGYEAARRVLARLSGEDIPLRGELVVLAGNVGALHAGVRHINKDLNRVWSESSIAALRTRASADRDAEDNEQLALLDALDAVFSRARGPVHLADLHTSSARGIPFVIFGDTLAQRRFVRAFPIPIIIGLEEQVDGVLAQYGTRRGAISFSVEGGQHEDAGARDNLEAVLWIALAEAHLIAKDACPEIAEAVKHLDERRAGLPRVLEVLGRRAIEPSDAFAMEPGFRNLEPAKRGQLLARDRRGDIRAESDGVVILPLYQKLGSDGFFWGRAVSERRLRLTELLRQLPLDQLLAYLPGVTRDPEKSTRFIVDTRIARLFALEVFHLLGYRRVRECGRALTVEK